MTDDRLLLVIDEGTTSTRAMLFDMAGNCTAVSQADLTQYYPASGHVEHDAQEIWERTIQCVRTVIDATPEPNRIAALGIANQRETIVFWDRTTGLPLAPAIVWQDRRTADLCHALREAGHEPLVRSRTGLLLDPYFSASKIRWALDHWPQLVEAGDRLAVGTIESYLVHRLTGGLHISDASNAARTSLMDLRSGTWDREMLKLFDVSPSLLPDIVDMAARFGTCLPDHFGLPLPICGLAGDQQAASIGQACLSPGQCKATYGTGAFVLSPTGETPVESANRLLSTVALQIAGKRSYALEGSIFVAGSLIQWLRDSLGIVGTAAETADLAASVTDTGGVYLIPAMTGLGAPHWRPDVRGLLSGLSFGTGRAHIARAALEAMAYQTRDLQSAFAADGVPWAELRIDGGMAANDWMAQDIADMLDMPVLRPAFVETTAKGAAMLAAVGAGLFPDIQTAAGTMAGPTSRFDPVMDAIARKERLAGWDKALKGALA